MLARRRRRLSGDFASFAGFAGMDFGRRRRRRRLGESLGEGLGRRKARKGKSRRKVCVKVGKRVFCGRPVKAPKKAKRARRRK
jgi:hypothetical protein